LFIVFYKLVQQPAVCGGDFTALFNESFGALLEAVGDKPGMDKVAGSLRHARSIRDTVHKKRRPTQFSGVHSNVDHFCPLVESSYERQARHC
jgi:hypothetical protein